MTIDEMERKIKEPTAAAIAALTDVLNTWAEIVVVEGEPTQNANVALDVVATNARILDILVTAMAVQVNIPISGIAACLLYMARKALEDTMNAPAGALAGGKPPWER